MPGWEPIVCEQLALAAHVGLHNIRPFVLMPHASEFVKFKRAAKHFGVELDVLGISPDVPRGEGVTLNYVYKYAKENPEASVLYFHTKGVSNPDCKHKQQWRRCMMRHMVAEWEHNLGKLAVDDLVGCAWQPDPNYPHFCGNFWAARCDWLANLPSPDTYRFSRADFQWAGTPHSWQNRIYVETWVGSQPYHSVHDRVCVGFPLWSERVFEVNYDAVPEFDWDQDFVAKGGL